LLDAHEPLEFQACGKPVGTHAIISR
jgi:hypothetical protein